MFQAPAKDFDCHQPPPVASGRRPSLITSPHRPATDPEPEPVPCVRRALATRLLAELPVAMAAHIGGILVLAVLLWPVAPHLHLIIWAAAVFITTFARFVMWFQGRSTPAPEAVMQRMRLATAAVALSWGVGSAMLIPHLPFEYLALLLLALSGLVAGASSTLAADQPAFWLFAGSILGPLPVAIMVQGADRFHVSAAILAGMFTGFIFKVHRGAYLDLTAQYGSAALLENSRRESHREHLFLDALFTSVPNAIVVTDSAGVCLGSNPGFTALYGYQQEDVVGRSLLDLIVPQPGQAEARLLQQRLLSGEAVDTEVQRHHRNGTPITVRISAARVDGGEADRLIFLYTDTTEIRRTEAAMRAAQARLELVLASSSAIIYALRAEGRTFVPAWVSENLERITGYPLHDALNADWWHSHLHEEDRARVMAEQPRLLAEGHLSVEYRFQQQDGSFRWIRDEARLIRDDRGRPQEIVGAWLDITDLKLAAQTMREGRDLAERSARARSEFLANMSHEIRTPMNAVLGLTELLLDSELTQEQRRSLRLVQSAGEALLTLLNDILDLSKIEAEHLTLESIAFDLRYLLESTVSLLSVRAVDRPVELITDVGPDVPDMVRGDPTRLRQVLTNLAGNALKFTERGEVVVSARREPQADGSCRVRFAVRDTGIGIPADKLAGIFEKFTQADASMTRKYGGTGLGLAIARRLVGLMGGELTVASEPGRGSEFAFTIPAEVVESRPEPTRGATALSGQRILVVDDNSTNRRIVREMLSVAAVVVDEAETPAKGIEALRRARAEGQPYAIAIIDAQMPDRDGFQLAAEVRADPALAGTVRLLMLTSAGQRGDIQRCREVGIEAYLMKPVSRSELLEATAALLGTTSQSGDAELITRHTIAESRPRLRLLLAEDNPVNQQVAATMLRKRGHTVTVVNNGREAVHAVTTGGPFDLVLMDIQMPELDGFAATREIRATPAGASLPILALTAHALTGERQRCLAAGMNGYVPKPFRPHELFTAVEGTGRAAPEAEDTCVPTPPDAPPAPPAPAGVESSPHVSRPSVDLGGFRRSMREAGAEESVPQILELFIEHAPERLSALAGAVATGDGMAIGRAAHAFRSPAGSIGAYGLEALLQEIELAGRASEIDRARATFEQVMPEAESVLNYLRLERERC